MESYGVAIMTTLTSAHIELARYMATMNYTFPWFVGYGLFHSVINALFVDSLVRPGRQAAKTDAIYQLLVHGLQVMRPISFRFKAFKCHADFLQRLSEVLVPTNKNEEVSDI